ncbi:MAG TPA: tyrosine-type recombinase/integrase, partial [Chloroflexota bacterium]|nr:tyrosine-type recombinase/integrase [Chloroflexota bacterium]
RGVLKEAWRLGLMEAELYHHASALENVAWSTPPRGRVLSEDEIRALFDTCSWDTTPAGARDAALLTVLYSAGLRRSEAAALDVRDYDASDRSLIVRGTTSGRERTLYAVDSAATTIEEWMRVRGPAPGPLFVPIDKAGKILIRGERMREQSVYQALIKRAGQAGLRAFSCQDLRRTFITRLLESGADISTVQRLAGHCSVITTQRYDRRIEIARRERGSMLPVPEHSAPRSG